MKTDIFRLVCVLLAGFATWSCDKASGSDSAVQEVIKIVAEEYSVSTKAQIIDGSNFKDESKGGGRFSLSAWNYDPSDKNASQKYIHDELVWYRAGDEGLVDANRLWRFKRGDELVECYWPYNGVTDFLAYMPVKENLAQAGVSAVDYSPETGVTYTVALPLTNAGDGVNQENLKEFLYAVSGDKTLQNSAGGVGLEFQHPLSAIYLKIAKGFRMTINSITFSGLKNSGTFKNSIWCYDDPKDMVLTIDKKIPDDINYGVIFSGPSLVLPQDLDGVVIKVNVTRGNDPAYDIGPVSLKKDGHDKWEPGKAYTYSLNLGDQTIEVLFDVAVQEWDEINHNHNLDVE